MGMFKRVGDIEQIPVGIYMAYDRKGHPHILEVVQVSNGTLPVIDGVFYFDFGEEMEFYAPFPELDWSEDNG